MTDVEARVEFQEISVGEQRDMAAPVNGAGDDIGPIEPCLGCHYRGITRTSSR